MIGSSQSAVASTVVFGDRKASVSTLALLGVVAVALSGCGTSGLVSNVFNSQPVIDDHVWLMSKPQPRPNRASNSPDPTKDATDRLYFPPACLPDADTKSEDPYETWVVSEQRPDPAVQTKIEACTRAMKQLIDMRFGHYEDALLGAVNLASSFLDLSVIGMNTAGTLIGGGTSQLLNAASAAVTGAQGKINNDILYNKSIEIILLQMKTDRAKFETIIEQKLHNHTYGSMYEAANDLYLYNRAGSWTEALLSIESTTGAQTQACVTRQQNQQLKNAEDASAPSTISLGTATAPCPVSSSGTDSGPGLYSDNPMAGAK